MRSLYLNHKGTSLLFHTCVIDKKDIKVAVVFIKDNKEKPSHFSYYSSSSIRRPLCIFFLIHEIKPFSGLI